MKTIPAFIKKSPVLSYFVLAFSISWGGVVIFGSPLVIPTNSEQFEKIWTAVVFPYFLGPALACLLLTGLIGRRAGFRELLSRLIKWRVGIGWYAVAILAAPLLVAPLLFIFSHFSPVFLPGIVTAPDRVTLLISGAVTGIFFGGLMEELGWTGFATPRLMERYGMFRTGLIVGVLHGVWHFPVKILISATLGLFPYLVLDLVTAVLNLTAWRILIVRVYDRTGKSLLLAMLMHASLTANTLFILSPAATGGSLIIYNLVAAAAAWLVVATGALVKCGPRSPEKK
jgi:membrane protease YdiL (CAAX protease family)